MIRQPRLGPQTTTTTTKTTKTTTTTTKRPRFLQNPIQEIKPTTRKVNQRRKAIKCNDCIIPYIDIIGVYMTGQLHTIVVID